MRSYYVGKFKGRKMRHLFTSLTEHENPICKRKAGDRFAKHTIVFPLDNGDVTCAACKKILYGGKV